jgi:hypothetical protein
VGSFCIRPVYMGCAPCAFNILIFTDQKKNIYICNMGFWGSRRCFMLFLILCLFLFFDLFCFVFVFVLFCFVLVFFFGVSN